jgi:4a-hydroxytetrahydrobiopterin dehydratase
MTLEKESCADCRGAVSPLEGRALDELRAQISPLWRIVDAHHLERTFTFPDFAAALAFTNRIGEIAEREGHHPDICLGWGRATVTMWTHTANGLTRSDFILAAKIDAL